MHLCIWKFTYMRISHTTQKASRELPKPDGLIKIITFDILIIFIFLITSHFKSRFFMLCCKIKNHKNQAFVFHIWQSLDENCVQKDKEFTKLSKVEIDTELQYYIVQAATDKLFVINNPQARPYKNDQISSWSKEDS